jgi:hypothetical protein
LIAGFLLATMFRLTVGAYPESLTAGLKLIGREADHYSPRSRMCEVMPPLPPYTFMTSCLTLRPRRVDKTQIYLTLKLLYGLPLIVDSLQEGEISLALMAATKQFLNLTVRRNE